MSETKKIKQAEKRLANFSARGSTCPICKQEFRGCPHTIAEARADLERRVFAAHVRAVKP